MGAAGISAESLVRVMALALLAGPAGTTALAQAPATVDLGPVVHVRESGAGGFYDATWTRRGTSPVYDGEWVFSGNGQRTSDTVEVLGVRDGQLRVRRTAVANGVYAIPIYRGRPAGKGTASWVSDPTYYWTIVPPYRDMAATEVFVEALRPHIVPRSLSRTDQAEVRTLVERYPATRSFAMLLRLISLGDSGDEDAMSAVIQSLEVGAPVDAPTSYFNVPRAHGGVRSVWGATFWQLHGADRAAARAMLACDFGTTRPGRSRDTTWNSCGFIVNYRPGFDSGNPRRRATFENYAEGGRRAPDVTITLHAVDGDAAFRHSRFEAALRWVRIQHGANVAQARDKDMYTRAYAEFYSAQDELAEARQTAVETEALNRAQRAADRLARYDRLQARRRAAGGVSGLSPAEIEQLEALAVSFGGEALASFAAERQLSQMWMVERLCRDPSALCDRQLAGREAADAAARAEADRRYAEARARALSGGVIPGATGGSGLVSVRSYDAQGNYMGSQLMSSTQAEILGAR